MLSASHCADLIDRAEAGVWLPATVNGFEGRERRPEVRDNDLALLEDPELVSLLHARLRPSMPARYRGRAVVGIHDRLRCYRYRVGQRFGLHRDQSYRGPDSTRMLGAPETESSSVSVKTRSAFTLLVYLNDDFVGGETNFPDQSRVIQPQRGAALVFQHMLLHSGEPVSQGTKYVLRTDILVEEEII